MVTTSETIAAMYSPPVDPPKSDPAPEPKEAAKAEAEHKPEKNRFQERISELVDKRKEAEAKAEAAERKAGDLEARLKALEARPEPVKQENAKPVRSTYTDDEKYIEDLAEWKANETLAKREKEANEARAKATQTQVVETWQSRMQVAMAEIEDYAEVVGKSETVLPGHLHQAIIESEAGPHLAYYFAKHPDEAKRYAAMTPTTGLRQLGKLEDKLMEPEPAPAKKPTPAAVEISKAPPPITTVRDSTPITSSTGSPNFDEYRRRRLAEKQR